MPDTILRSLEEFKDRLNSDQLKTPSIPDVALRVRQLAAKPNSTPEMLGTLIGEDAALSAWVVRAANSPLMNRGTPVRSIAQAVLKLGFGPICNMATAFALQQTLKVRSIYAQRALRQTWIESKQIAALSSTIARTCGKLEADQALLAGMVHRIGVLPLIAQLDEMSVSTEEEAQATAAIEELHPELGSRILREWGFAADIACVPEEHRNPCRTDLRRADLCDAVAVAFVVNKVASGNAEWLPPLSSFESGIRLKLDCNIEALEVLARSELVVQTRELLK